jgi:membrane-associated PAP2 superfamily phosphatase
MIATAADVRAGLSSSSAAAFWWQHARIPLIVLAVVTVATNMWMLDSAIARTLFFDAAGQQWIGAHNWWTTTFLHDGGRWAIRVLALLSLLFWAATFARPGLREWRWPAGYFTVALVLAIGLVGLLKTVTNVDCPWDLQEFGGRFPYVHLFANRPAGLKHAQCFPAAHASSGYALMALYFVAYERGRGLARIGLAIGLFMGLLFGIAQQSRGAHFFSHDVWSACITWLVSLSLYTFAFKRWIWRPAAASL